MIIIKDSKTQAGGVQQMILVKGRKSNKKKNQRTLRNCLEKMLPHTEDRDENFSLV